MNNDFQAKTILITHLKEQSEDLLWKTRFHPKFKFPDYLNILINYDIPNLSESENIINHDNKQWDINKKIKEWTSSKRIWLLLKKLPCTGIILTKIQLNSINMPSTYWIRLKFNYLLTLLSWTMSISMLLTTIKLPY